MISMSEAENNVGRDAGYGKRRFVNGDACPWDKGLVLWGYNDSGEWWVSWGEYKEMCKRNKISKKKKKKDIHPHKRHKKLLLDFWNYFLPEGMKGGNNLSKINTLNENSKNGVKTRDERLNKLKEYSQIVILYKNQKGLLERRDQFNRRKDTIHSPYHYRNRKCFVCLEKAECRHHIIQLQNGGINSKKNLVSLCHSCHSEIHAWMK